ncbi:MAG: hypothetical protein O3A46_06865, partial [Candidatus Poribacteria bacterium]|nr:hypothetical protein [Candidatus Poribacteria bacterium]
MDPRTALRYSVLFALAWCALSGRVAAVDAEIPVGVRSLGMGRTGIASPGRASAMSLNVGSLTSLEAYSAEAFTTDLFGLIRGNYLAAVVPLSDSRALGFDWNRLDYEDTELGFQQNRMRAAYGFRLHERLGLGAGVNYRTQSASLDGGSLGGAAGWSADLGLQWTPPVEGLTVGWSVRNWMSNTSGGRWRSGAWMRVENGEPQRVVPRLRVFGLAYERGDTTARLEWHEGARFGVERQVADWFAVRGGIVKPNVDGEGTTFSLGATGQWRWGAVDYALVISPDLPPTSYFGLAFGLSYRIPPVIVEGVVVNDLYVALRDHYARIPQGRPRARSYESPDAFTRQTNERLGELWLYNPGEESVPVRVRLWIDKYPSGS